MRIKVYHTYCGCECGACGHQVEIYPFDDGQCYSAFEFGHPDRAIPRSYARGLVETFLREYHPELLAEVDWSAMELDVVSSKKCCL